MHFLNFIWQRRKAELCLHSWNNLMHLMDQIGRNQNCMAPALITSTRTMFSVAGFPNTRRCCSHISLICFLFYHAFNISIKKLWISPGHMESSGTRDRTHVPCIGRQILIHSTTREAPILTIFKWQLYIHNLGQPPPPSISRTFSSSQTEILPYLRLTL